MHTFGLSSTFHLRTADIYLLNESFEKVAKIGSEREFKVLHNLTHSAVGMPQKAVGFLDFTLPPSLPTGIYYIKYVSGWTLWRHESEFSALSPHFAIASINESLACNSWSCLHLNQSNVIDPKSFTVETAPTEVQFMYSHSKGAARHFLNGVVDGLVALPKALVNIKGEDLKHPIDAMKNASETWEEGSERDPWKATGQMVGAAVGVGVPTKMVADRFMKPGAPVPVQDGGCADGHCTHDHGNDHGHDHGPGGSSQEAAIIKGAEHSHDNIGPIQEVAAAENSHDNTRHIQEVAAAEHSHDNTRPIQEVAAAQHSHDNIGPIQEAAAALANEAPTQNHVFEVRGVDCPGCKNNLHDLLKEHGQVTLSPAAAAGQDHIMLSLQGTKLPAEAVVEMLESKAGFLVRHVV